MADESSGDTGGNSRVTLAVVQTEIRYLRRDIEAWRTEAEQDRAALRQEICERLSDHEQRLRALEGSRRQGNWQDLATAVGAGVGIVLGALGIKQ